MMNQNFKLLTLCLVPSLLCTTNAHAIGLSLSGVGGMVFGSVTPKTEGAKALSASGFQGGADILVGIALGSPKFRLLGGAGGRYLSVGFTEKADQAGATVTSVYKINAFMATPTLGAQYTIGSSLDLAVLGSYDYGIYQSIGLNRTDGVNPAQSSEGKMDSFGGLRIGGRFAYKISPKFAIGLEPAYHLSNAYAYQVSDTSAATPTTSTIKGTFSGFSVALTLSFNKIFGESGSSSSPALESQPLNNNKKKKKTNAPGTLNAPGATKAPGVKKKAK